MTASTYVPTERDFRGQGCDDRCRVIRAVVPGVFGRSEILLHDPSSHESYGRLLALAGARAEVDAETITTGCLSVNLATLEVLVNGQPIRMTAVELRLVLALARRVGMAVEYADLHRVIWGDVPEDGLAWSSSHNLRVNMARIRAKLGAEAGALIVTIVGVGLRLDAVPAGEAAPSPVWTGRRAAAPWATYWQTCLQCGSSRWPHAGHGYCTACRDRATQRAPRHRHQKRSIST